MNENDWLMIFNEEIIRHEIDLTIDEKLDKNQLNFII